MYVYIRAQKIYRSPSNTQIKFQKHKSHLFLQSKSSDVPIVAMAAIYFCFSMAGAALQSTIIVYVSDPE